MFKIHVFISKKKNNNLKVDIIDISLYQTTLSLNRCTMPLKKN